MSDGPSFNRRRFLATAGAGASMLSLGGCDAFDAMLGQNDRVRDVLASANQLTYRAQRLLFGEEALARTYAPSEIRQQMRPNGSTSPNQDDYTKLQKNDFADYRLEIGGLVDKKLSLSLDELRNMPARSQITRHDCVEGWSVIAKWTGVQLSRLLDQAGVKPQARYVLFHCYDSMGATLEGVQYYYETIDLISARHPQTILAYGLNDKTLPVSNGAPLRVRVERQLGYKMAKYIRSIELVSGFANINGGNGGYWEDQGYDWWAGT
ncbi:molybdopterin-binding protein [Pararhizobium mangrovi]|uniref:Molybdopterin oxidoreductase n=1 Tax=Pararhizobium mangrovi TaxID=2590452 RepID=A0A506U3A3_9HYPH|nr:molybdopterin-binding protein [Pararhizobium mangrovi]TPW26367.1 molybdopterin oxidoreductase [Pararhizobium mangrovi]